MMASPLFRRLLLPRLALGAGLLGFAVLGGRLAIALTTGSDGDPAWAGELARQSVAGVLACLFGACAVILGAAAPSGQPGGFAFLLARPIARGTWLGYVLGGDAVVLAVALLGPGLACGTGSSHALGEPDAHAAWALAMWGGILASLWSGAALGRILGLRPQYAACFGLLWGALGAGAGALSAELLHGHAAARLNLLRDPLLQVWRNPAASQGVYDALRAILFGRHAWAFMVAQLAIGLGAFAASALVAIVRARRAVPRPLAGRWAAVTVGAGLLGAVGGLWGLIAWTTSHAPAWHRVGQGTIEVSLRAPGGAHVSGEVWLSDRVLPAQTTVGELLANDPSIVPASREGVEAFDLRAGTARFGRLVPGPYHVCGLTYPSELAPGPNETGAGSALMEKIFKRPAWARALPVTCALVQMSSPTAVVPVGLTVVPAPAFQGGTP